MNKYFFINTSDSLTANILQKIFEVSCNSNVTLYNRNPLIEKQTSIIIDDHIATYCNNEKKIGCITTYGNYRFYDDSLRQKTKTPFRRLNVLLDPESRLKLIFSELFNHYRGFSVATLDASIKTFTADNNDHIIKSYLYHYFLKECGKSATQLNIDLTKPENLLFVYALTYVLSSDYTNIPVPGKNTKFEAIIDSNKSMKEFADSFIETNAKNNTAMEFNENITQLNEYLDHYNTIISKPLSNIQKRLFENMIHKTLHSIYYPHISKSLYQLHQSKGYNTIIDKTAQPNFKLLSIQLNSNRPAQLASYFDNLEETTDHQELIEVIVNIDDNDQNMLALITNEIKLRKFTIKYKTSQKPSSFCDLWKPINEIFKLTNPNAYFVLNISDEMFFTEKGWDTRLKKYVDLYPDGLFRLRASRNKVRAYFDRWECSFAQDSIPITTKKWVDIGGDWNPCFGPDSFQQLISFYLSKEGAYSNEHTLRDVPVFDIQFSGDVPSLGMEPSKHWKHIKDHIDAMFIFHSQPMLQEAKRRALLIKANMLVFGKDHFSCVISDDKEKKLIKIFDVLDEKVLYQFSYKVGSLSTFITNNFRKLNYFCYFGDGNPKISLKTPYNFLKYLRNRHLLVYTTSLYVEKKLCALKRKIKFILFQEKQLVKYLAKKITTRWASKNTYFFLINLMAYVRAVKKIMQFLSATPRRVSNITHLKREVETLRNTCNELKIEREFLLNKLSLYENLPLSI